MNIAIIGHGRMGKEVQAVAQEKNIAVACILTSSNNPSGRGITPDALKDVDVCIDFSSPDAVVDNIEAVASCKKNIVVGTTGWHSHLEKVTGLVSRNGIGLLHSANFSLGVNIFARIIENAARIMDNHSDYDAAIAEVHHRHKTDSPSGTALALGTILLQAIRRKGELLTTPSQGEIAPGQLHIGSLRTGNVTGWHSVIFDSDADTIELTHTAKSRRGYALGAIAAAGWLKERKGIFTMEDVVL